MKEYRQRSAILRICDFFVFSNIFIACCTIVMGLFTSRYFTGTAGPADLYLFLFAGTLTSYSFHWYLTHPEAPESTRQNWLSGNKRVHLIIFFISIPVALYAFVKLRPYWLSLVFGAFFTFLYSAPKIPLRPFQYLKKYAVGKTIFLSVMWTYCTCALPLIVQNMHIGPRAILYLINRFTLILAICIIFDIRDKDSDINEGIRSLITLLRPELAKKYFDISIIVSIFSALALLQYKDYLFAVLLIIPAIITFTLYKRAIRSANDYTYYFVLDGLMALSPVLYFLYFFIS